jgi:hypothetical protein
MINDPINFRDEHFQPHQSPSCHLLIHLDTDSYSYAIIDQAQNQLKALVKNYFGEKTESFSTFDRLEILKAENENIGLDFGKVKISVETRAFTFVPDELYSDADLSKYSKFIGVEPDTALLTADISAFGIKNVTAVERELDSILTNAFPESLIVSQANSFLAGVAKLAKGGNESQLYLNTNIDTFEAAVIKNGSLDFYNIFEVSNADEFNYFLVNLINQLNIDRNLPVFLSGEIQAGDEQFQRVQKYFATLNFANNDLLNQATGVRNPHRLFSLASLDLCE